MLAEILVGVVAGMSYSDKTKSLLVDFVYVVGVESINY
jgi:hypothetical protein